MISRIVVPLNNAHNCAEPLSLVSGEYGPPFSSEFICTTVSVMWRMKIVNCEELWKTVNSVLIDENMESFPSSIRFLRRWVHKWESRKARRIQLLIHFHSLVTKIVNLVEVTLAYRIRLLLSITIIKTYVLSKFTFCIILYTLPYFRWLSLCFTQYLFVECQNISL